MGWRGTLRSLGAAQKRQARTEHRKQRLLEKANSIASNAHSSFDKEATREIEKIRDYEAALYETPISKCGLQFSTPNRFEFAEFSDRKGIITYQFHLTGKSDNVHIEPNFIDFEKRRFKIVGVCFFMYGTCVAFELEYKKEVPGSKATKIINKTSPDSSLLAIKSGNQLLFPIEGSIDGQLVPDTKKSGIVVFEPFENSVGEFEIVFIPKEESDDDNLQSVKISGHNVTSGIKNANAQESVLDTFSQELSKARTKYVSNINAEKQKVEANLKSSGCAGIAILAIGVTTLSLYSFIL